MAEVNGCRRLGQCGNIAQELCHIAVVHPSAKGGNGRNALRVWITDIDAVASLCVEVDIGNECRIAASLVVVEREEEPVDGRICNRQVYCVPLSASQCLGILLISWFTLNMDAEPSIWMLKRGASLMG